MADFRPLIGELDLLKHEVESPTGSLNKDAMEIPGYVLEALKNGSHDAYTEIFESYHEPILHFLTKIIHSEEDAQEITQEVFFHLWEKRAEIDPRKNVKGYLYTTAKFYTLDYFRHKKVITKYEQHLTQHRDLSGPADESFITKELHLLAEIVIARMPRQQQQIFRMRYEECKSNEEIAEILHIKPETVRVHLMRGRQEVRDILMSFIAIFIL